MSCAIETQILAAMSSFVHQPFDGSFIPAMIDAIIAVDGVASAAIHCGSKGEVYASIEFRSGYMLTMDILGGEATMPVPPPVPSTKDPLIAALERQLSVTNELVGKLLLALTSSAA